MAVSQDWARVVELAARAAEAGSLAPVTGDSLTRPVDDTLPTARRLSPSTIVLGSVTRWRFEPSTYLSLRTQVATGGRLHVDAVFGALELAADEELGVDRPALDLALAVTWRPAATHVAPGRLLQWARGRAELHAVVDVPAEGELDLVLLARKPAYELAYEVEVAAAFAPSTLTGRLLGDGVVTVIVVSTDGTPVAGMCVALGDDQALTDGHGRATFTAPAGRTPLTVGATGAVTCPPVQVIGDGQARVVLVRLSAAEAVLAST